MSDHNSRYYRAYLECHQVSRRGLLRGLLRGAERAQVVDEELPRQAIRPPHAAPEALFLQRCDGCGLCQQACQQCVIEVVDGRAQLNLDYGACNGCDQCLLACTTAALSKASYAADTGFRPNFARCQNELGTSCAMCAHCCPTKAVTLDDDLFPTVDDSKCIGCGVCRQTCPFNRISPEPLIASDKR